ncbi:SCY1 protein kinase [Salpingoeca rosetta]|uniref:SCY1 protein kinase n=1 Tax=Salpingoeca rosetta (strain ATCC 50818 / BSB-021) TaxID=946362 RepID=F2U6U4_SALR5|nr:SCY1 protein kinase [Salpingoeca rosetta]EGD83576.1 SCY1 protein kinase [Salpingoeca rosetta]|eukprot:XP_004995080.1 SCY1 protein kinase [Salpingoeca rosetta]
MQRLRSTFSGNACLKEYDVGTHVASAGTCLLWRVHDAVHRGRSENASVFIFDKKAINQDKTLDRRTKDRVFELARQGASQLQKLRHPNVLRIVFPVTESKDYIAFATERVVASLSNLLGKFDNLPKVSLSIKQYELDELECSIGISQVCDALSFCHDHAQLIHGNVTPDAIVVTQDGSWKLWAFDFACHVKYQEPGAGVEFPEYSDTTPRSAAGRATQPALDYLAPEYIVSRTRSVASDVYSLGHVIFACFNHGRPILESNGNVLAFQSNVERISRMSAGELSEVPSALQDLVKSMLNTHESLRPTARDVPQHQSLNTTPMLTLRFVTSLHEKDNPTKAQFMKELPKVLHSLPRRVVHQRVLPALQRECKQSLMAPFVLPNILTIADGCSIVEFEKDILPHLMPLFSVTDPVQVQAIFLGKLSLLLEKSPSNIVKQHILPMIYRALSSKDSSVVGLCLQVLPSVMNTIDYAAMKNELLPLVQRLVVTTTDAKLRINGLVCLGQLLPVMDKWIFQESMLPMLEHVKQRDAGVVMAMLGVLHQALRDKDKYGLDACCLSTRVLVLIAPFMAAPNLNLKQFTTIVRLVRDITTSIENERTKALKEREVLARQADSTVAAMTHKDGASSSSTSSLSAFPTFDTAGERDVLARLAKMPTPTATTPSPPPHTTAPTAATTAPTAATTAPTATGASAGSIFDGFAVTSAGISLLGTTTTASSSDATKEAVSSSVLPTSATANTPAPPQAGSGIDWSSSSLWASTPSSSTATTTTTTAAPAPAGVVRAGGPATATQATTTAASAAFSSSLLSAQPSSSSSSSAPSARLAKTTATQAQQRRPQSSTWATSIFDAPSSSTPATAATATTPTTSAPAMSSASAMMPMTSVFDTGATTRTQQASSSGGADTANIMGLFAQPQSQPQQQQQQQDVFASLMQPQRNTAQSSTSTSTSSANKNNDLLDLLS